MSRAKEEVKARIPERIAVPTTVLEELDKATEALPDDSPFRKRATDRTFSDMCWPLQIAVVKQNELVKRYGLRTNPASLLDSLDWMEMPTCVPETKEGRADKNSKPSADIGIVEAIRGIYEYTIPLSEEAKWTAGFRCHLCHSDKFISVVGHHLLVPGYVGKPWTHVVEIDFASPDLPKLIEQPISLLFEKVPEYYSKFAKVTS